VPSRSAASTGAFALRHFERIAYERARTNPATPSARNRSAR